MKERKLKSLGVALLGALALFLASCGQQPPPSNGGGNGGGSGGGSGATTGTLEVVVQDASTNNPIQGAQVILTNTNTALGITDSSGKVTATLAPGTYGLKASKAGYQDGTATATVTAGQTTSVTIKLQAVPSTPGVGVCRPQGDLSFTTNLKGVSGGLLKSIQRTNGSGEDCFAKGQVEFSVSAPGATRVQVVLATTNNFTAGQLRASGTESASFTLDTATLAQGVPHYIIARVEKDNRILDQYWVFVPDNLGPQIPDVRPVNKLNPDDPTERWVNKTVQLQLQNPDFRDNPDGPNLLASGLAKVTYYALRLVSGAQPVKIAEATAYPYQVSWDTTEFQDGRYRVYAVAEDVMGNQSQAAGFVVGVDNTGPELTLAVEDAGTLGVNPGQYDIFGADSGFVSGVAKVTYRAYDSGVGINTVDLNWGSGNQSLTPTSVTISVNVDVNNVDDGEVTFVLRAKDQLGNESKKEVKVVVDNNAPTLDHFNIQAPTKAGNRVNAGDQATYEVLANDPTSGIREVRYYYASDYGATPLADGGLFQIATRNSALSQVVFPVFDPQNLESGQPASDLWVIAIAVDRAGNAKAFYQTLKVVHTANADNGVDATQATLDRTSLPDGHVEHEVRSNASDPNDFSPVLRDGSYLKVAYYWEGAFDGAQLPAGMPAGVTTTVRTLVAETSTPPYKYLYTANLNALLFNEYGHWGDLR
ncbi:carboxypeptidase regulatory-like domain-containing protein [Thermus thermophilus]|uniref:carboxypeptidase regulatory-like domain-containing protein n=1 Tax=Thermus thermophilus TaxID=274 RepID=UPI0013FD5DFB|nr:carboxypeptidase regulatory-like domain-containing protein [Thermus thermophilus]